jgi:hypothetical protein
LRWSNSDPITGQAAWFDLKVRIEKSALQKDFSEPQFAPQHNPVRHRQGAVTYGAQWQK